MSNATNKTNATPADLDALATATVEEATASLSTAAQLFATHAATDDTTHAMAAALIRCESAGVKSSAIVEAIDAAIVAAGKGGTAPSTGTLSNLRTGYRFAEAAGFDPAADAFAVARSVSIISNTPKPKREALAKEIAATPREERHNAIAAIRKRATAGEFKAAKSDTPATGATTALDPVRALAATAANVNDADAAILSRIGSADIVAALDAVNAARLRLMALIGDRAEGNAAMVGADADTVKADGKAAAEYAALVGLNA